MSGFKWGTQPTELCYVICCSFSFFRRATNCVLKFIAAHLDFIAWERELSRSFYMFFPSSSLCSHYHTINFTTLITHITSQTEQNSSGAYLPIAVKSASEEIVYLQLDSRLSLELLDEVVRGATLNYSALHENLDDSLLPVVFLLTFFAPKFSNRPCKRPWRDVKNWETLYKRQ